MVAKPTSAPASKTVKMTTKLPKAKKKPSLELAPVAKKRGAK